MRDLRRDLTGRFVGCDGQPRRATCSFHDASRTLEAGDRIQIEVERVMDEWSPLFHRCEDHAVESFPHRHSLEGALQALVVAELAPTGAYLPETYFYAPGGLTLTDVRVVDVCAADEGRRPRRTQDR